MLGTTAGNSSAIKPQFEPINNYEAAPSGGQNIVASEQSLKDNSASWTSWLTGPNISISRSDTQIQKPTAPSVDEQMIIEQALAVIQKAQGIEPEIKRKEPLKQEAMVFDESGKEKLGNEVIFYSRGEIIFNSTEKPAKPSEDEYLPKAPTNLTTDKIEQTFEKSRKSEPAKPMTFADVKKVAEEVLEPFKLIFGGIFSLFKGIFGGILATFKENAKRPLTAEEQKAKAEKEKKQKERNANKKEFYSKLGEGIAKFNEARRNERMETKQRLGITELDIASANKLLSGENQALRNLSNREIDSLYHDEQTAIALILKRKADKEKEAKKHSFKAQGKKAVQRGPSLEMSMEKQHGSDNAMTKVLG